MMKAVGYHQPAHWAEGAKLLRHRIGERGRTVNEQTTVLEAQDSGVDALAYSAEPDGPLYSPDLVIDDGGKITLGHVSAESLSAQVTNRSEKYDASAPCSAHEGRFQGGAGICHRIDFRAGRSVVGSCFQDGSLLGLDLGVELGRFDRRPASHAAQRE
jgi:hypothetical protein